MKGSEEMNAVLVSRETFSVPASRVEVSVVAERDGRTMNNMDPESKRIHVLLERWGKETRSGTENGWPPVTTLGKMIIQGPVGALQAGRGPTDLSPEAARTDAAVAKCCEIDRKALTFYYQGWMTVDMLAKRLSMRVRQAQNVLRRARWRVGAHLDAMP
jgi:hypothetical protein